MPFECPKCKSPVAREGQRFCYRCGQELKDYYDSLKPNINSAESPESASDPVSNSQADAETPPPVPVGTVILKSDAFSGSDQNPAAAPRKASLKVLLPTGDVFDRDITDTEIQIGKGPRNDIVIADPAVSAAHAVIRIEDGAYVIDDLGSRNGTFIHGERVTTPRPLNHGDVIGIGLSKLTFRLDEHSDTTAIELADIAAAIKQVEPPALTEESLARAVVDAGLATKADVDRIRGDGKGRRLYRALVEERLTTEDSLRDLMSSTFQIPIVDLNGAQIDGAVVAEFPPKLAREHQVFAVAKDGDAIVLAVADPTDTEASERVRSEVSSPVIIRLATATQIREKVRHYYRPKLIGVLPSGEKLEYPIDKQEIEIGKASHNHITLTDPTVSNTHAIVTARETGYTIVDLGSRNGTFVNDERLGSQAHTLRHGDKIQLGQTVLTFRNPGETSANATEVLSGKALEEIRKRAAGALEVQKGDTHDREKPPARAKSPAAGKRASPADLTPAFASSDEAVASETSDDEKGEKKKKKKKKKGDERMRAAYVSGLSRIVAQVMGVVLAVMLALYVNSTMRSGPPNPIETGTKGKAKVRVSSPGSAVPFKGGVFEASGATYVPGRNGVLIVDDGRPGEVLWMQLDESGSEVGQVKPIPLGVSVDDPEAITSDGNYFYIIGSQSRSSAGEQNALVRFAFDATSQIVQKAEAMINLRDFLIANVPELKDADKKENEGGLNIEGISWDFKRGRWLLGLRSPLANGSALVVAIKLKNPAGAFSVDNLELAEPNAIPLKMGGLGIRDIQYDPEVNSFLLIAGAPEHHEKPQFALWEWTGSLDQGGPEIAARKEQDLDPKMKPEGITHVEVGGRKFILIVGDAGSYLKLDYSESQ
jgi:pSer/pThr/pTyr-binding forkhead associated (FHA) protein